MQIIKSLRKHKKYKSSNRKVKARLIKNNKVSSSILTNINNIHSKLPDIALTNNTRNVDIHQLSIQPNRTSSPYDEHLHKPNCVCFIILFVFYLFSNVMSKLNNTTIRKGDDKHSNKDEEWLSHKIYYEEKY